MLDGADSPLSLRIRRKRTSIYNKAYTVIEAFATLLVEAKHLQILPSRWPEKMSIG